MNTEKILEEILENTKAVKVVVVEKEEAIQKKKAERLEKSKSAKQKAEAKFVRIGTKLNEAEMKKFNSELERLGLNQSQYIKKLLNGELTPNEEKEEIIESEDLLKGFSVRVDNLENEIIELNSKIEYKDNLISSINTDKSNLEADRNNLKAQLDKELTKSFWSKVRALF